MLFFGHFVHLSLDNTYLNKKSRLILDLALQNKEK